MTDDLKTSFILNLYNYLLFTAGSNGIFKRNVAYLISRYLYQKYHDYFLTSHRPWCNKLFENIFNIFQSNQLKPSNGFGPEHSRVLANKR